MKRILLIIAGLFTVVILSAQTNGGASVAFEINKHDFGQFKEEAGPQTFSFDFTNNGGADLLVTRVTASCGCTTPEWTKSPVKPGEKGYVKVTYDPRNRPNKFKKSVVVYTNSKPAVSVLVVEGDVIPRELTIEEIYRTPVDGLRFRSNHMAFTDVVKGSKKIRVMEVINTSDENIKLSFERVPPHLKLVAKPEVLKPGKKGIIEGTYNSELKNDWGYVNDLVRVVLNDVVKKNFYMVVSANLTEDFGSMTKAELETAPVAKFETTRFDFGTINQREKTDVSFKFKNEGKSDLIIRKVRSSCGCTTVTPANMVIKPGETSTIDAVFDAGARKGKQHKGITVITNDPKNSQINLIVSGEVKVSGN
ncbi:MAG: DUF1573 domain-containing protein [Bacteroidales bacterium]|nr:DUF1573 domain-containing protein [Bacteroidales bacterium]